jgi:hypothetical protein
MKPLEKFSFEEEWRRALADASEQPPASVWDKIEQALDEKPERKAIFWLWLNNNRLRVAAGIALLFSFGFLMYKTNFSSKNETELASTSPKVDGRKTTVIEPKAGVASNDFKTNEEPKIASAETPTNSFQNSKNTSQIESKNNKFQNFDNKYISSKNTQLKEEKVITLLNENSTQKQAVTVLTSAEKQSQISTQNTIAESLNKLMIEATALTSKSKFQLPPNRLIRRLILDYEVAEVAAKKSKKEFWLGLQSGGGSFNPNFSNLSINTLAAKSFDSPYSPPLEGMANTVSLSSDLPKLDYAMPQNKTKASEGFRNGLTFGMKLSKNWSIESGLAYVRGNSYIQSNTYSIDKSSGIKNTYFADYIANNSGGYASAKVQNQAITTVADEAEFLNRYEFVSIPMQAGFTFLAKKKLNFSLLAGASADIFMENLIGGNTRLNVSSYTISQSNDVYKPVNISGLGTFRVNYRLQKNWQAYLGGQYQQGLGSLLLDNSAVNLNLKQRSIQTGLNYKF